MTRRKLLVRFLQAFGAGVAGVIGIPALLHVMSPVVRRDDDALWRAVGSIADFPPGEVRRAYVEVPREDWARALREKSVYVWHSEEEGPVVFARNCTDLSCPLEFDTGSGWFFCPCHGGIFDRDGTPKAGPPNRPLYRFARRVRDGVLEIDLRSLPPLV